MKTESVSLGCNLLLVTNTWHSLVCIQSIRQIGLYVACKDTLHPNALLQTQTYFRLQNSLVRLLTLRFLTRILGYVSYVYFISTVSRKFHFRKSQVVNTSKYKFILNNFQNLNSYIRGYKLHLCYTY
jgi:hypothetical protein